VSAMSRYAVVAVALFASACVNKPSGFGVDVEARTSMLPSGTRDAIVNARLVVSGAESFAGMIPNAAKAAKSGAMKFRYVPGVRSGTLTIRVDGLDGSGNTLAAGISQAINLVDGKSVDAVFFLATNGNGVPCMIGTDCISNNCVDGVCCDTPCDGICETCNLASQPGLCSPQPMGMDPDNDCAAKVPMQPNDDGGIADEDGGVSMMPPPVGNNLQACAGVCDGNRMCSFPPSTTSCGDDFCAQPGSVGSFFCDGNGACNEKDTACVDYNCDNGACRTSCGQDSDCQTTDFCNLNINKCVPKHPIGTTCTLGDQCQTGNCYTGVCCNTTCGDPTQNCNDPSSTPGHCVCTGHPCPAGIACTLFYRDSDADGQGDKTATLTNGKAIAGCVGDATPTGYSTSNTDCDDGDPNAFLGQTAFFSVPSATAHTFDYNCDGNGTTEKGIQEGFTCGFCQGGSSCTMVSTCSSTSASAAQYCSPFIKFAVPDPNAITNIILPCFARFYSATDASTGATITGAFAGAVPCGMPANVYTCGACSAAGNGSPSVFNGTAKQICH
jgi:hypothetical protein